MVSCWHDVFGEIGFSFSRSGLVWYWLGLLHPLFGVIERVRWAEFRPEFRHSGRLSELECLSALRVGVEIGRYLST